MPKTPFAHQKFGVKWLVGHRGRSVGNVPLKGAILADDMGLGKTLTALLTAKVHAKTQGTATIIISPKSVINNWKREAAEAGVDVKVISWGSLPVTPVTVIIKEKPQVTYKPDASLPAKYVLLADEAQMAQDENSERTKCFLALARDPRCVAVYPITGTPAKNGRPLNMLPLLKAINHHIAVNDFDYQVRYCKAHTMHIEQEDKYNEKTAQRKIWQNKGAANLDELFKVTQNAILRRTKDECLDLPEKIREFVEVELDVIAQHKYDTNFKKQQDEYHRRIAAGEITGFADAIVMINLVRMAASIAKTGEAIRMAEELLEQGRQVVIFTEFAESAKILANHFEVEPLTGEMSTAQRQKMVDEFQAGRQRVFVGTIRAGGVGITLTASQDEILVDRPWTPGDTQQVEDRLHRIGQKNKVNIWWLRYGAIDDKIDNTLEAKMKNINHMLTGNPDATTFYDGLAADIFG